MEGGRKEGRKEELKEGGGCQGMKGEWPRKEGWKDRGRYGMRKDGSRKQGMQAGSDKGRKG